MNLANNSKANIEINIIYSIARQCPFSGGTSVYKARSILYLILPDEEYNDFEICTAEGLMRKAKGNGSSAIIVSPNPSKNTATVLYQNTDDPIKEIQLLNMQGELIEKTMISKTINTSAVNEGVYIMRCFTSSGNVYNAKLSVVK